MGDGSARQIIYSANDVATYTMDVVDRRAAERQEAMRSRIPTLDKHMKPLLPGETVFVSAYTSNGKTAFMSAWARNATRMLQEWKDEKRVVVYITWETLVEEEGLYDLCSMTGLDASAVWYGDADDDQRQTLRGAAMRRATAPLWLIGYSLKRRREIDKMTMPKVLEALRVMEDSDGLRPAVIFLDYVQKIPPMDRRGDRREQVLANVDAVFQLARDCGAPVVAGCQAGRQVLERGFKLPEIGDGQETSRIEQDADKVLALWYPCKSEAVGTIIDEVGGVTVSPNLMICGIRKQRHAASGQVFPLHFDPGRNTFSAWGHGQVVEEDDDEWWKQ